uniref:Saposin B-type domain-containing protein n=1 Tax=Plectus sambesii TaxID=2011161 RepID=A0A914V4Q3_9BILA
MNAGLIVLLAVFASVYALPQKGNSIECSICEMAVGAIEKYLTDNEEAEEQEIIDEVCNRLPGVAGKMCANLVTEFLPAIINYMDNDQPPSMVCGPKEAGFCPPQ